MHSNNSERSSGEKFYQNGLNAYYGYKHTSVNYKEAFMAFKKAADKCMFWSNVSGHKVKRKGYDITYLTKGVELCKKKGVIRGNLN